MTLFVRFMLPMSTTSRLRCEAGWTRSFLAYSHMARSSSLIQLREAGVQSPERSQYSCRQRYFCPSCHQKKVQLFGELLTETIPYPVPHRHLTLGIPKMLRPYFRHDRDLLKDLCRIAHECLLEYLRTTLDLPEGIPGIVMTIHSYGEYLDWHPHLHLLMADGLFVRSGLFYVLPQVSLKPLEGLFRARVTCPQCYSVAGGSRFSWTGVCCRPRGRTCRLRRAG